MLGIIAPSGGKSRLHLDTRADFPLVKLELSKIHCAKRWLKRLKNCGVSRAVISEKLSMALGDLPRKFGVEPITGYELLLWMSARIAIAALAYNNVSLESTGAEIYSGAACGFDALCKCSGVLRYVSVCGRRNVSLAERASEELGISPIVGAIPKGLCENILRLYFDGRDELFEIITKCGALKFESVDIILPRKYSMLCDSENALGFAQALVQSGKLKVSQIGIGHVRLSNC